MSKIKITKINDNEDVVLTSKVIYKNSGIYNELYKNSNGIKMHIFFDQSFNILSNFESSDYGVYFLIDKSENSIYIGKTKNFKERYNNHKNNKKFNQILFFSSSNWTHTIIEFLEYWFITFFKNNNYFQVENKRDESEPKINEHDEQQIRNSLEEIKWMLLTINIDITKEIDYKNFYHNNSVNSLASKEIYVYFQDIKAIYIKCNDRNKCIKLLKDTIIKWNNFDFNEYKNSKTAIVSYNNFFEKLIQENKIEKIDENTFKLNQHILTSCSMAAQVVKGYFSIDGKTSWKTDDNKSIKELNNERIR